MKNFVVKTARKYIMPKEYPEPFHESEHVPRIERGWEFIEDKLLRPIVLGTIALDILYSLDSHVLENIANVLKH